MGWLFSTEASMLDYANADDLKSQWFYRYVAAAAAAADVFDVKKVCATNVLRARLL
jgi:hypothetical protein